MVRAAENRCISCKAHVRLKTVQIIRYSPHHSWCEDGLNLSHVTTTQQWCSWKVVRKRIWLKLKFYLRGYHLLTRQAAAAASGHFGFGNIFQSRYKFGQFRSIFGCYLLLLILWWGTFFFSVSFCGFVTPLLTSSKSTETWRKGKGSIPAFAVLNEATILTVK